MLAFDRNNLALRGEELHEHLMKLFSLSSDLFCIIDFDGRFMLINDAWTETLGWTLEELYSKPFYEFIHPDDRSRTFEELHARLDEQVAMQFENRYICKDGHSRWMSWTGVRSIEKQMTYGIGRDVTEDINAREQLALALESCRLGIWDWRVESHDVFVDERARQMFGFPPDLKIADGECFRAVVHQEDIERISKRAHEAYENSDSLDIEFRVKWPDGSMHWLSCMGKVIRGKQGVPLRMVGVVGKIDERKSIELDRERKLSIEQAAVRKRDEFFGTAAHELRSPLTSLKLSFDLFKKSIAPDGCLNLAADTAGRVIHIAQMQLETLNRAVSTLFDVVQASEGRMSLLCDEWDMVAIVRRVVEQVEELIKKSGSTLTLSAPPEVKGFWDGDRIERVIWNLITNAVKYGNGKPISVAIEQSRGGVKVIVEDQGPGIAPDQMARLFQRFERAKGMKKTPGLGLGLYIVKQIVSAHGGQVNCDSVVGQGSKFSVYLPYRF